MTTNEEKDVELVEQEEKDTELETSEEQTSNEAQEQVEEMPEVESE